MTPVALATEITAFSPPAPELRNRYLDGPQHRWLFWFQTVAFVGVAASLAGFATQTPWTWVLLVLLALMVVEQVLALSTSTLRRRLTSDQHQATVDSWRPDAYPSVDVFVPTAGEDLRVLHSTLAHAARIDWPGRLVVTVLDDAGRPEVEELARRLGLEYLARPGNAFKKAGNLQYAFERTDGDHILILDADFVPSPGILRDLVPYLDDATVGVVQSPQYFRTDREMGWLERCAGATQEIFFRFIQVSRDAVDAAICVGTSAVYRRAALAAIGGFPLIGHSEDVVTGVRMARVGYRLRYVPVVVSQGRCPDDLDSFIAQQYRWCEGSMMLVADRDFHADPAMTLRQRLCYWAGFVYYVTTALFSVVAPVPILVMVLAFPDRVAAVDVVPLVGVMVLWLVAMPLLSRTHWRIEVLRVQLVYGFAHLLAIADGLQGRRVEWVPTGSAGTRSPAAVRVRRLMVPYLLVTQLAVIGGLLWRAFQFGAANYWTVGAMALLNAYVALPVAREALVSGRRGATAASTIGTRTLDAAAIAAPAAASTQVSGSEEGKAA